METSFREYWAAAKDPFEFSSYRSAINTWIAYYHAINQFLGLVSKVGFKNLEDIEPITMATIRIVFSGLRNKEFWPSILPERSKLRSFLALIGKTLAAGTYRVIQEAS